MTRILIAATLGLFCFSAFAQQEPDKASKPAANPSLNPAVSANILTLFTKGKRGNDPASSNPNGFSVQETELQFSADVDPYLRGNAQFAVHQEGGETHIEIEEAYFETLSLPVVTFKGGKFQPPIGRHNQLHTHAFPFIDAPLANQEILGDESHSAVGISASILVPLPWFSEVTVQGLSIKESEPFQSTDPNALEGVARLRNLWDLSEATTFELGLSGARGPNAFEGDTNIYGADLTLKWRPTEGGKYQSVAWSTEYLARNQFGNPTDPKLGGIATWIQYQFAQRWWVQGRLEQLGIPRPDEFTPVRKQSALLGFFPSEFSGLRLQYDHMTDAADEAENRVSLQLNISIGAHPAHAY